MVAVLSLAVTLMLAAVKAVWQLRSRGKQSPVVHVRARMFTAPGEWRGDSKTRRFADLPLVEVEVSNRGGCDVSVEEWRFVSRGGDVIYPPPARRDGTSPGNDFMPSCPVPCDARAHRGGHRWYVSLDWLESENGQRYRQLQELWRLADLRPCVRLGGERRWVRARQWGIADEDPADGEPRKTDLAEWRSRCATRGREWLDSWPGWHDYRRWRKEVSRPHRAALRPALIPVGSSGARPRSAPDAGRTHTRGASSPHRRSGEPSRRRVPRSARWWSHGHCRDRDNR
jgi:hypothetical protein